jgi:CBS domain-containing protein
MKVQDVMSRELETCRPEEDLNRVAQLMWERDVGVVPVVEPSGAVIGMITDRDLCMAAYTQGRHLASIGVGEVMSRMIHSCAPGTSLESALAVMKEGRVRRLPVIDSGGGLVGLLSLNDLVRGAVREVRRGDRQLGTELIEAFAVICEPRAIRMTEVESPAPEQASRISIRKAGALTY